MAKTIKPETDIAADEAVFAPTGPLLPAEKVADIVMQVLDEQKAEEVVKIDLAGKTSIGDYMIIGSGRVARHVSALADYIIKAVKEAGHGHIRIEGMPACDWVVLDLGDVVVHLFRPEVREFYNLEKMWLSSRPAAERLTS